jgi:hypothetical protein
MPGERGGIDGNQIITSDTLLNAGVIEGLVRAGREPIGAGPGQWLGRRFYLFIIPPAGFQVGDRLEVEQGDPFYDPPIFRFHSPDGKERGLGSIYALSLKDAKQLRQRIDREHLEINPPPSLRQIMGNIAARLRR